MATKFNPLKFYAFNNVKVLDSSDLGGIVLYADNVDLTKRFEALLAQVKAGEDPNFDDLIRLITGLGFVIYPGKMGVLTQPIPMFNRSALFNSESPSPGKTIIKLLPENKKIIGNLMYDLFKSFDPTGRIFQDKNFSIPDIEQFNVNVDVIGTKANVFDIYKDDQLFTNGELNPTKNETSLTYAYAFETFEVQGTQELVLKKVELASPNNERFIKEANNESNFDLVAELKNIIYDGENTAAIEKEVLQGDAVQDIGVDKLYNVVTVEIPKTRFGKTNILDYSDLFKSSVNPPSNSTVFDVAKDDVGSLAELKKLVTELSFLVSLAAKESKILATGDSNVLSNYQTLTKLLGYQYNLDTVQLDLAKAEFLKSGATNKDVIASKSANFKSLETFLKLIASDNLNFFSTVQTQEKPEFISKFVESQQIIALDAYYRLFEGLYNKREVAFPSDSGQLLVGGLTSYNISELFQALLKTNEIGEGIKEAFNFGTRQNALYRNSRLSGIKVVKSTIPYDPVNPNGFNESTIQTFHIAVNQGGQDKTLTLFDSQVVYGEEYYYTAFGVYEVDGKFYSYDNVIINSDEIKTQVGEKIVPNTVKEGPDKGYLVNPCCRALDVSNNQNLFGRQSGGIVGVSGAKDIADAFFDVNVEKSPSKADILEFVNKTITFSNATAALPIPGMTDTTSIIAQGPGAIKPPIPADFDPSSYPVLVEFLFSIYIEQFGTVNGNIYESLLAYGFKNKGVIDLSPDYYTGNDPTSIFLNQKRAEMFCFLCRRAGTTDPSKFPTAARIIEQRLKKIGVLGANEKYLGNLVDCTRFGFVNPDGTGGLIPFGAAQADPVNLEPPTGALIANKCSVKEPVYETKNNFTSIEFDTNEMDSKTIVEVPLDDAKATIVGRVPMPPDVTFVPLADVDNKVLIRFLEAVQSDDFEQPIDAMLSFLNGTTVMNKLKEQSASEEFVLARSQGDLQSVVMFRSDVQPNSLSDLILNENAKNVSIDWSVAEILDPVLPNKDYWYVFATRDFTGLYSAASPVFRLKLVNDSGYTYADLEPYEFVVKEEKNTTKTFKKLIKIKPSFDETLASNAEQIGTLKLFSTIKKGNAKGATDAPPKFKIRIRSRKTKRAFDINLKYTQDVAQIKSKKLIKIIEENAELLETKITGVKNTAPSATTPSATTPSATTPSATPGSLPTITGIFEPSTISGQSTPIPVPEEFAPSGEIPTTSEPLPGAQPAFPKSVPISETITPATVPETPTPSIDEPVEQSPAPFVLPEIDLP